MVARHIQVNVCAGVSEDGGVDRGDGVKVFD